MTTIKNIGSNPAKLEITFPSGETKTVTMFPCTDTLHIGGGEVEMSFGWHGQEPLPIEEVKPKYFDPFWIGGIQCKNCKFLKENHTGINNPGHPGVLICPNKDFKP